MVYFMITENKSEEELEELDGELYSLPDDKQLNKSLRGMS